MLKRTKEGKKIYDVDYDTNGVFWFFDSRIHRELGPAIQYYDGTEVWYKHGVIHREHGCAIKYQDGNMHWFYEDDRFRDDGPAIINSAVDRRYHIFGRLVSFYNLLFENIDTKLKNRSQV
jgi:hypothetical protein